MNYSRDSFFGLTKVSCAEMVSYTLTGFEDELIDSSLLVREVDSLLKKTPDNNKNGKLLNYSRLSGDDLGYSSIPELIVNEGVRTINSQKKSVGFDSSGFMVLDNFLVDYYSNSVTDFYNSLPEKRGFFGKFRH